MAVGQQREVLCEGYDEDMGMFFGRSAADAPDIDGMVYFNEEEPPEDGEYVAVTVESAEDGDLFGTAV